MSQGNLSKWIKGVMLGVGACGLVLYAYIIPYFLRMILERGFWAWLVLLFIAVVPCFIALYYGWRIGDEIGRDNSFSHENSQYLKRIAILATAAAIILFIGNVIYLAIGINTIELMVISITTSFVCVAVSIIAAALSHLVENAAELRDENESYI